jgi:RHS repeat-associated protein
VTDENDNVVQTLDYFPYGSTRVSSATSTNERRKFIGQFVDDSTLSYLNARYYNGAQGQFISEDPAFWSSKQNLYNPQGLNAYSYANDNPITTSDPSALAATVAQQTAVLQAQVNILQGIVNLYKAGATQQGNSAFAAYQTAFGNGGNASGPQRGGLSISSWSAFGQGNFQVPNISSSLTKSMNANAANILINDPLLQDTSTEWRQLGSKEYATIQLKDVPVRLHV